MTALQFRGLRYCSDEAGVNGFLENRYDDLKVCLFIYFFKVTQLVLEVCEDKDSTQWEIK